ncbi:MAG: AraC family transcriptional regulator [Pseudomonadota bacterium]
MIIIALFCLSGHGLKGEPFPDVTQAHPISATSSRQLLDPAGEAFIFRPAQASGLARQFTYRRQFGQGSAELFQPYPGCAVLLCDGYVEDPDSLRQLSFQTNMVGLNIVVLADKGEVALRSEGNVYTADPDQAILVRPDPTYDRTRDITWAVPRHRYAVFLFNPETTQGELSGWGVRPGAFGPSTDGSGAPAGHIFERDARLDALAEAIWDRSADPALRAGLMKLRFAELALLLSHRLDAAPIESPRQASWIQQRIAVVKAELDRSVANPPSMQALAQLAGLGRSRLSEQFHKRTGMTLQQYLVTRRLALGRSLLVSSSRSVSEIARACGYRHTGNFSRAFRSHFGVSPNALRKG